MLETLKSIFPWKSSTATLKEENQTLKNQNDVLRKKLDEKQSHIDKVNAFYKNKLRDCKKAFH